MSEFYLGYEKIAPTTWVYLSSLLMLGLYFKFSRIWSIRNLDLALLILLAPGLILVEHGQELQVEARAGAPPTRKTPRSDSTVPEAAIPELTQVISLIDGPTDVLDADAVDAPAASDSDNADSREELQAPPAAEPRTITLAIPKALRDAQRIEFFGFLWLFSVGAVILIRMLLDPLMVRRPLLEPNLTIGGLTFLGCALLLFLIANVVSGTPRPDDLKGARGAEKLLSGESGNQGDDLSRNGPGYPLVHVLPKIATTMLVHRQHDVSPSKQRDTAAEVTAKTMAIIGHLAIVLGIIAIGYWHFDNLKMGIGTAALYLLLPYTAQMMGRVDHVLPAALLVWAVMMYRRPLTAGLFLGLAVGVFYYPLFLLPLWLSFYWQRGLMRFISGVAMAVSVVVLSLLFTSGVFASGSLVVFLDQLKQVFGVWLPKMDGLEGIWNQDFGWDPVYRLPILAAFFALGGSFALWPAQKNLGTLLGCSAAIMLAAQFWHGFGGGLYMAWYLPLVLLTVFRPNLEDRVALTVLGEGWFPRRLKPITLLNQAA